MYERSLYIGDRAVCSMYTLWYNTGNIILRWGRDKSGIIVGGVEEIMIQIRIMLLRLCIELLHFVAIKKKNPSISSCPRWSLLLSPREGGGTRHLSGNAGNLWLVIRPQGRFCKTSRPKLNVRFGDRHLIVTGNTTHEYLPGKESDTGVMLTVLQQQQ